MQTKAFDNYIMQFDNRKDYFYVKVTGKSDSLDISTHYWNNAIQVCNNADYKKLLVIEKFENQISVTDMFIVCEHIAEKAHNYNIKVAFIDLSSDDKELNEFGETVIQNRGAILKIFKTEEEAKIWLLKD